MKILTAVSFYSLLMLAVGCSEGGSGIFAGSHEKIESKEDLYLYLAGTKYRASKETVIASTADGPIFGRRGLFFDGSAVYVQYGDQMIGGEYSYIDANTYLIDLSDETYVAYVAYVDPGKDSIEFDGTIYLRAIE